MPAQSPAASPTPVTAPDLLTWTSSGGQKIAASAIEEQRVDAPLRSSFRPSFSSIYSDLSELSITEGHRSGRPLIPGRHTRSSSISLPPSSRRGWRDDLQAFWIRNKGAALVLSSQLFACGMSVATRILETHGDHGEAMHPFQLLFVRMSITFTLSIMYGLGFTRIPHFPFGPSNVRGLLIARGLAGFFGVFGLYFSLLYLPLAEATVLTFLAPILTCYACSLLIPGETFTRQQQMAAFLSLFGVVFIAIPSSNSTSQSHSPTTGLHGTSPAVSNSTFPAGDGRWSSGISDPTPPTTEQHIIAILVAMLGVLGSSTAMTTIRRIGHRAHPLISVNYFSLWCTLVSLGAIALIPSIGFRLPGNWIEWGLLIFLGICGFFMQYLLTAGLSYGGQKADNKSAPEDGNGQERGRGGAASNERQPLLQSRTTPKEKEASSSTKNSGMRATSMIYTQMLFALTFDKLIWGITPGASSWLGSGLILGSAVWVAVARDRLGADGGTAGDKEDQASAAADVLPSPDVEVGGGTSPPSSGSGIK